MNVLIQMAFHTVCFRNAILDFILQPVSQMAAEMGQKEASCPKLVGNNTSLDPIKVANGLYALKTIFSEMENTRFSFVDPEKRKTTKHIRRRKET